MHNGHTLGEIAVEGYLPCTQSKVLSFSQTACLKKARILSGAIAFQTYL